MELRTQILRELTERAAPLFQKQPEEMTEEMRFVDDLHAKSVHYSQITI
jgi:acyl carrier protein